jgi:valyl-tRNA synthetase
MISHPSADPEKGTGLMMMCSMGDITDIRFFRELGIKPVIAISVEGRMNSNGGFLEGKTPAQARKAMVEVSAGTVSVVTKALRAGVWPAVVYP